MTPGTALMVEKVAVKYDAAWRSGWLSEENLWKNPYCEGMVEATAFMSDKDEQVIRDAVGAYCATYGYMPMKGERPEWLGAAMERWTAKKDIEAECRRSSGTGVKASRAKLHKKFADLGFTVMTGPKPKTQWVLTDPDGQVVWAEIHAHADGSEACYHICNEKWNRIA